MQKIPTVFVRDFDNNPAHVLPKVTPGCEWVLTGEGQATRKYDGTCVMLDEAGKWWARREVKPRKPEPPNYIALSVDTETGKTIGWEPISQSSFAKFHAEALQAAGSSKWTAGTFELIGPKVNGNPEGGDVHRLVEHAAAQHVSVSELTFEGIRSTVLALAAVDGCEGIVWHNPDGRMAKIKARDFPKA
ncbi:DUF5565 family protein [Streptomyces sp. NPDC005989]|uniref:RNA ligase 1 family protein n=1 Tax=Streptomyces sp. NPDC005989 TaxID=3156727 RepID=UPI0033FEDEDF